MKAADLDLRKLLKFAPEEGKLLLGSDRMLLFRKDAFTQLRRLLYENMGEKLARVTLARFGYQCGEGDFEVLSRDWEWDTEEDLLACGPAMHTWEGLVHVAALAPPTIDRDNGIFRFRGDCYNSYEAEIHLELFGQSATPVCYSHTGYASGWCTALFGKPVLGIETQCVACGDELCRVELRDLDSWGPEADPWRQALESTDVSVARELEEALRTVEDQREAIAKLSAPILQIWDGVLAMPVIGVVDAVRAEQMMEDLLQAVARSEARFTILDLTGVDNLDTATANHLVRIVKAVGMLGSRCLVSGLSSRVARTMATLGIQLGEVDTFSTLQAALQAALRSFQSEQATRLQSR